jgi:putative spermidine/putrescine transport system permease protein
VASVAYRDPSPRPRLGRRVSAFFHRHPRVRLAALLALPVAWLLVVYIGSLAVLLVASFWQTDPFTSEVVHTFTLDNFRKLWERDVYRHVAWRTIRMAALVTVADAVLAFPIAYYMARVASRRTRGILIVAVVMPLWASYLVKAYAWRTMLAHEGALNWALAPIGLAGPGLTDTGLWLVFTYLWLPFMILPIYAGLERIPNSLLEASADLGARSLHTFVRVILPLAFPAVVAGSIFTFSLTLGDYIAPGLITSEQFIGTVIYSIRGQALPLAAAYTFVPIAIMVLYLFLARKLGAWVMLRLGAAATLVFLYAPLIVIGLYAFNAQVTQGWPIQDWSTKWFRVAYEDEAVRQALWLSVQAALLATLVAMVLGTLLSLAVSRYAFFGRETVSFIVILPIALPGIITGLALQTTFQNMGIAFGLLTIIIGHATFCIVVVYNNALARLRRLSGSFEEASADLGADSWQTFRYVTFPELRTPLLAGALLAFALSFDEVIVTLFTSGAQQTLPIWIFANLQRPRELPVVNVVALFVLVASIIPVYFAQRLSRGVATGVPVGEK